MSARWAVCGEQGRSQSANTNNTSRRRFHRIAKLICLALFMGAAGCPSLRAQSSSNDPGAPNLSGVTDVTPGWKYLLQNDDLAMVQVNTDASGVTSTSLLSMNTSNSALSGTQQTIAVASSQLPASVNTQNSVLASEAAGRMFNTNTDSVGILYVYGSQWAFSVSNSAGVQAAAKLNSVFTLNGTVFTQVVMGDFKGDGLVEPLAFYENTNPPGSEVQWGMMVLPPVDPTAPWNFKEGPELSATTSADRLSAAYSVIKRN